MSFTYLYSISQDFNGFCNQEILFKDIKASSINTELLGSSITEDNIIIFFESELSSDELTTLNDVIANHDDTVIIAKKIGFNINPITTQTLSNVYEAVATFEYEGSSLIGPINYFDLNTKTELDNTYDARIYDSDNNKILAEITGLNNQEFQIIDMGSISNIPQSKSILELHVRSNNSKKIFIQRLRIYHNNTA